MKSFAIEVIVSSGCSDLFPLFPQLHAPWTGNNPADLS
jgi:hypothetical protein